MDYEKYLDLFHSDDEEDPCISCRESLRMDYEQNEADRIRKEGR